MFVVSVDRKALPLATRAHFAADASRTTDLLYGVPFHTTADVVVLSTCERFEVYGTVGAERTMSVLASLRENYGYSATAEGDAALRHLFRVASGLESRLPGEPHVLGQVRGALNEAVNAGAAVGLVKDAFTYAIRCGKRVRQQTALGMSASSYVNRVVSRLASDFGGLEQRDVAIVGTGALAMELATALRDANVRGLTLIGRHEARTVATARRAGAAAMTVDQLLANDQAFDAVVTAVSAAHPLVTSGSFENFRCRLFVDLGAAPNVDPAIDEIPGVQVLRLEHFGGVSAASFAIREAERVVARELERYLHVRAPGIPAPEATARRRAS